MGTRCAPPLDLGELHRGDQERERQHKGSIGNEPLRVD
jgi:hypothetical protein